MNAQQSTTIGLVTDGKVDDIATYRQTLGSFMTGVTVITTLDADGNKRGITANSFTSVSLDPPLVLFCVDYRAASYDTWQSSEGFVIHILASEQQDLAKVFASKAEDKFAGLETVAGSTGSPILQDVHGWLDCKLSQTVIAGDHAIIIGEVVKYSAAPARPLGFYQGRFFGFNTDQEIASLIPQASKVNVGWMMQNETGEIVCVNQADGSYALPKTLLKASEISADALTAAASAQLGSASSVEFLYSIFEGKPDQISLVYRGQVFASAETLAGAGFETLTPADVNPASFTAPGEAAVVERYLEELSNARFGVYAGTLAEGSVALVEDIKPNAQNAGE